MLFIWKLNVSGETYDFFMPFCKNATKRLDVSPHIARVRFWLSKRKVYRRQIFVLLRFKIKQILPELVSESVEILDDTPLTIQVRCLVKKNKEKENRKRHKFVQTNWKEELLSTKLYLFSSKRKYQCTV